MTINEFTSLNFVDASRANYAFFILDADRRRVQLDCINFNGEYIYTDGILDEDEDGELFINYSTVEIPEGKIFDYPVKQMSFTSSGWIDVLLEREA